MKSKLVAVCVFLFLLILLAGAGIYIYRMRRVGNSLSSNALVVAPTPFIPDPEWTGASLPFLDDCLLRTTHSCFPSMAHGSQGEAGVFQIRNQPDGDLNYPTIRAIMLGDREYNTIFTHIHEEQVNSRGLIIDKMVDPPYKIGMNPLVVSEMTKREIEHEGYEIGGRESQTDAAKIFNANSVLIKMSAISQRLGAFYAMHEMPSASAQTSTVYMELSDRDKQAYQFASTLSTSSTMKSIISYFYADMSKTQYEKFITSFRARVPTSFGTKPIIMVSPDQLLTPALVRFCLPTEDVEFVCRYDEGIACGKLNEALLCRASYKIDAAN